MKQFHSTIKYKSAIISSLKKKIIDADKLKKSLEPIRIDFGSIEVIMPRHFGFCYGVENAIEITQQALKECPNQRIFLLGELIHNQYINQYFKSLGVQFLMTTKYEPLFNLDTLTKDDIIIIPAFGAPLWIEEEFRKRGLCIERYQSTCPFVVKVWNRANMIANLGFTIIVHGTPFHEETESTCSRIRGKAPFIIVNNINKAKLLVEYIKGNKTQQEFEQDFKDNFSEGFDIQKHLSHIGIINQTTMLASETQYIIELLKSSIQKVLQLDANQLDQHFAKTRDTLCYATNDNQKALTFILHHYEQMSIDIAFAVGGYNSSNTSHLVELCEKKIDTYFVSSKDELLSSNEIAHFNIHNKTRIISKNYLKPVIDKVNKGGKAHILLLGGASCPDILIEETMLKLMKFIPKIIMPRLEKAI